MKTLFTLLLTTILFTTANANTIGDVKIGPKGNSTFEIKLNSTKAQKAMIVITNENGDIVNTIAVKLISGTNAISLIDVETLAEGTFTVKITVGKEVTTSSFINLKGL